MEKIATYAKYLTAIGAAVAMAYGGITFHFNTIENTAKEIVLPLSQKVEKLEDRLTLNELKDLLKDALDEMYYWRKQARKYPDDIEIADKLEDAEENVKDLKERIKKLQEEEDEN